MNQKFISCVLVASLSFCIGCSSSYIVSSSKAKESFSAFNAEADDKGATVEFQDGTKLDARNVIAFPDSIRFFNRETDSTIVVPTETIRKVVFTNSGIGFLEGFGIRALAGVGTIVAISAGSQHTTDTDDLLLPYMALGGGVGGVIGGLVGLGMGHSYEWPVLVGDEKIEQDFHIRNGPKYGEQNREGLELDGGLSYTATKNSIARVIYLENIATINGWPEG